ncbi:hypothetical protein [Phenylobacterium sp.]|uniref:hypothetical protein n=1 Tax=Phenylobacterium sp. TaxID=1871053 RepID=UPI003568BEFE
MSHDLDHLLSGLAQSGPDRSLAGLEASVLGGIMRRREAMRTSAALTPFRVASIGLAMAIGVTAGGMAAPRTAVEPRQLSTFSADAHLAPSTLLEGGR